MNDLHYLVRKPVKITQKTPLLVLLHGYGSNEKDLFSFKKELSEELLIISLRAPLPMGFDAYAWYTINFDANKGKDGKSSNLIEAKASIDKIASSIEEIKRKYHTNPSKTFLVGFSQGAVLSYALSFLYPNRFQKVAALSGYINQELLPELISKEIKTSYYCSHGTVDQILPIEYARKTKTLLDKLNLKNEYHEYSIGHGISPENFYSFREWIEKE